MGRALSQTCLSLHKRSGRCAGRRCCVGEQRRLSQGLRDDGSQRRCVIGARLALGGRPPPPHLAEHVPGAARRAAPIGKRGSLAGYLTRPDG